MEKGRNLLILNWIVNFPDYCPKTVAVASRPPFFEPKARRKEHGGLEATATLAEVSFSNGAAPLGGGTNLRQRPQRNQPENITTSPMLNATKMAHQRDTRMHQGPTGSPRIWRDRQLKLS